MVGVCGRLPTALDLYRRSPKSQIVLEMYVGLTYSKTKCAGSISRVWLAQSFGPISPPVWSHINISKGRSAQGGSEVPFIRQLTRSLVLWKASVSIESCSTFMISQVLVSFVQYPYLGPTLTTLSLQLQSWSTWFPAEASSAKQTYLTSSLSVCIWNSFNFAWLCFDPTLLRAWPNFIQSLTQFHSKFAPHFIWSLVQLYGKLVPHGVSLEWAQIISGNHCHHLQKLTTDYCGTCWIFASNLWHNNDSAGIRTDRWYGQWYIQRMSFMQRCRKWWPEHKVETRWWWWVTLM